MTLQELLAGIQGWNTDVQRMGVRPGYGLQGTMIQSQAKSPYQPTLGPGEQRTASELQNMLANVILAAGSGALPGAIPGGRVRTSAGNRIPPDSPPPIGTQLGKPITGKGGAKIVGYQWQSKIEDVHSERTGDTVARRVSDWDRSGVSTGTGRDIVHYFYVQHPDGRITLEGINSAGNILGLSGPSLRRVAKVEAGRQAYAAREEAALVKELESVAKPTRAEAARILFERNKGIHSRAGEDALLRLQEESVFLEKGGQVLKVVPGRVEMMERAGWNRMDK